MNKTKMPIGMLAPRFVPIANEPANSHPTYGAAISLGHAVKAYLTVQTSQYKVYGDGQKLIDDKYWTGAQLDTADTDDDLDVFAALYGSTKTGNMVVSGSDDVTAIGGYGFIQELILRNKSHVFRGVWLYRVSADLSAFALNADQKGENIEAKSNAVKYDVFEDNLKKYIAREDFSTQAEAEAWLQTQYGATTAYPVTIQHVGTGVSDPGEGAYMVTGGQSKQISFGTNDPDALYDNAANVTANISAHKYTIANIAAAHEIVAVWNP